AVVRPHDDPAAIALQAGIGVERDIRAHVGVTRIENVGIRALIVTADERGAATGSAGDVDDSLADETDAIAEHRHRTARARRIASGRIERAARLHDTIRSEKPNRAATVVDAVRAHDAGVVDEVREYTLHGIRGQQHLPAVRLDRAA